MKTKKRIAFITALVMLLTIMPFGVETNQDGGLLPQVFTVEAKTVTQEPTPEPTPDKKVWDSKSEIDPLKNWRIKFSKEVDPSTINNYTVRVTSQYGDMVEVSVSGSVVTVRHPIGGYTPGETYTLHVGAGIRSINGKPLSQPVRMDFTIEE